ncbi:DUF2690 domain-containing protein [Streptomyces sp. H10-C2]|uniref:DUF2690 domain-containing protein n=1 Tax=unclassified Streptomyces TaxID=2593676 RepID=UPI0024BBD9D3|nr:MULTISPECIES: DUF2690 domain-containing protein [unclassified Streptomyces]MDJ0342669.1 DUF2690 domain-containing protein [Streptomyces sp. PH10-H1]MDJ0372622.1 DUF2690 domain-containing protein [Streptomyces sp. H10-C2]
MRNLSRRFATAGAAMTLAASGVLFAGASPASAATWCQTDLCNGLDPSTTVCQNDAETVSTTYTGVELRYSPYCRTAWARGRNGVPFYKYEVMNNRYFGYSVIPTGSGPVWTAMINDADLVSHACQYDDHGNNQICSKWF